MNELFDILLVRPISEIFYNVLISLFFTLHFFFVLLMLGTAFFSLLAALQRNSSNTSLRSYLPMFFTAKSLAVNFGVMVVLLVMVFHSLPFATAANLNAPFFISIILLLIAAFIFYEIFDRALINGKRHAPVYGVIGFIFLLLVPAIFVAFVVTAENPDRWREVFHKGVLFSSLLWHWLTRLLHVFGAAVVVTAMVFMIVPFNPPERKAFNTDILFAALLLQIMIGIILYMTLPSAPGPLANMLIILGAAWALGFAWVIFKRKPDESKGKFRIALFLFFILIPMLMARHILQNNVLNPLHRELDRQAKIHKERIADFTDGKMNEFLLQKDYDYNLPHFVYQKSCSFCHGTVGDGKGIEANNLKIPPVDLTTIRTDKEEILRVLENGVPGTAMPRFKFHTKDSLLKLIDYLYKNIGIQKTPEPIPVIIETEELKKAEDIFRQQCAICHGENGKVSPYGAKLEPPPHDMTAWNLEPHAAFGIISEGIPNTDMKGHPDLSEKERWALVMLIQNFYKGSEKK